MMMNAALPAVAVVDTKQQKPWRIELRRGFLMGLIPHSNDQISLCYNIPGRDIIWLILR